MRSEVNSGSLDYRQVNSQISEFSITDETILQYEINAYRQHVVKVSGNLKTLARELRMHIFIQIIYGLKFMPGTKKIVRVINSIIEMAEK